MTVKKMPLKKLALGRFVKKMLAAGCLCLAAFFVKAQNRATDYDAKWKTVDSLDKAGLPESALTAINRIYALARQEHNEGQEIKALIYGIMERQEKRENDDTASISELEAAVAVAGQPSRSILQALLADEYWYYFQRNRWNIYNRTATVNFVKTDISTWGMDDFLKKIAGLYFASLMEEKILLQVKLDGFDPILVKGNMRYLRPTLFDVLAHEALGYFKGAESDINQPTHVFEIDDPAIFSDAFDFASHRFFTTDTSSPHYRALLIFQQLIRLHLTDPKPDALIDVDIERLAFANAYAVMENKAELYLQSLIRITERYRDLPAAAQGWYLQARQAANGAGDEAIAGDTVLHRGRIEARNICERVLREPDNSEGRTNCRRLLDNILQKELKLEVEKVNIPGQPFRSLVTWRNFTRLQLRLIRLDSLQDISDLGNSWEQGYWDKLLRLPVYRSLTQSLPATEDYRLHRTEIAIGSLPAGRYALLACADTGWARKDAILTAQSFYVSTIAYINQNEDFFVLNRETGQPLGGASVQAWQPEYDSKTKTFPMVRKGSYTADQQGHFRLANVKNRNLDNTLYLDIRTAGERLFMTDQGIASYYYNTLSESLPDKDVYENNQAKTFLFLDRRIYRPGQFLYFKGIIVTLDRDTHKVKIRPEEPVKLVLYNANHEKMDSLELTTNEYGSYHGVFRLPERALNGEFSLTDESTHSREGFSVEEYKRPRFYITYDKQKGSYRVGDSIRVVGNVQAYAGNTMDGATLKYRVVRETQFIHPWMLWRGSMVERPEREIAHGEVRTDANGVFHFLFAALADQSISPAEDPRFEYDVVADVTDISGETRSGSTQIIAGYTVLNLAIDLPGGDKLPADSLKALPVSVSNLSGEPVASRVHLIMYPLKSPQRLIRGRLWEAPDILVMPEAAFRDSFPHDEYGQEMKKERWARGPMALEMTDSAGGGAGFPVPPGRLMPGWYVIEASTTDRNGQVVQDQRDVELYDGKTGRPANPEYSWAVDRPQVAEPGENALIETGTSAAGVYVIRLIEKAGEWGAPWERLGLRMPGINGFDHFSYFSLDKEKKASEWMVTEADRGGFGVWDVFIKDNRIYTQLSAVQVPWTNKDLQIRYATYRDKTEPGSEEKWAVTISGNKGSKVAAEVLASMYDASLDQFTPQSWTVPDLYPRFADASYWQSSGNFEAAPSQQRIVNRREPVYIKNYDRLWFGSFSRNRGYPLPMEERLVRTRDGRVRSIETDSVQYEAKFSGFVEMDKSVPMAHVIMVPDVVNDPDGSKGLMVDKLRAGSDGKMPSLQAPVPVQIRKNFNETAFFFPDLRTDSAGNVSFSFMMPEALTQWKWMTLAHTRDLAFGYSEKTVVTQKQLMVQPNVPRFLREGDKINFSVKVVNLTDSEMTGQMGLALTDPTTGETADGWFVNRQPNQYFTVAARGSSVVEFPLDIPFQYNRPLSYRIVAQAGAFSDGEEAVLPVVSNRMLVTETLPLNMAGDGTRSFRFDKLLQSGTSETLSNHALTVEFTANPAWYAVQALPYLMEFPYECAEQVFDRLYANALASKIVNSSPRIAQVFARWRVADTAALLSNLEKNSELKSVLLEETPWVLQGKTESQQKKNIALLFDTARISGELESAMGRLKELQAPDGGFAWFKGGPDDRFVTQYILTGIGHLQRLQALPAALAEKIKAMVVAALPFVDQQIRMDYERELKMEKGAGAAAFGSAGGGMHRIGALAIQYLYMRSMFNDYGIPGDIFPAVFYYRKLARQEWMTESKYMQGMIALALFRTGDQQTGRNIIASLRQTAIHSEELGMCWKGMEGGYYWYQAPIETESLLIEAFREISGDTGVDRELKTWLLRQKQTHNWATTKATADAVYALLLGGQDWLTGERSIGIRLGDKVVDWGPGIAGAPAGEAGTGYYKKIFDAPFINPSMGDVTVTMRTRGKTGSRPVGSATSGSPAWGAVYWQYFDQLDRITPTGSGAALRLVKRLFVQRNTDRGPVLDTIPDGGSLKVGDRVVVRIELRADRDLEYVHLKDMRGACLEPVNVLSGYKWQGGLGYYETTKDASTEFFFPKVGRGTYVFEYTLVVGQTGEFSNGVSSVECMYAPEFAFHTEGIRINVEGGQ